MPHPALAARGTLRCGQRVSQGRQIALVERPAVEAIGDVEHATRGSSIRIGTDMNDPSGSCHPAPGRRLAAAHEERTLRGNDMSGDAFAGSHPHFTPDIVGGPGMGDHESSVASSRSMSEGVRRGPAPWLHWRIDRAGPRHGVHRSLPSSPQLPRAALEQDVPCPGCYYLAQSAVELEGVTRWCYRFDRRPIPQRRLRSLPLCERRSS
jgi:hypothetical protein